MAQTIPRGLAHEPIRHHVLGEALFKDALLRERRHADRCGHPFLVLVVDRGRHSLESRVWTSTLHALVAVKRQSDLVGWLERRTVLGLLLPEAAPGEASLKLIERVRCEIARRLGKAALTRFSMRVYAHGEANGVDSGAVPSVDLLLEAFAEQNKRPWCDTAKRGLDILGSLTLLMLCAPLFAVIFAAVKSSSQGPALFRQVRTGLRGRQFTIFKFRTMDVNAGHALHQDYVKSFIKARGKQKRQGDEVFKLTNDPRITPVGRFLRKTSLDELPQFWNVLRGDMSLVGPRPPLPFEVEHYQPWHRRRVLDAKPGITGLWQVSGRSRTTFDEMVRLDLRYARTRSLWTDLKILAATPRAVFTGKGAY